MNNAVDTAEKLVEARFNLWLRNNPAKVQAILDEITRIKESRK